MRSVGTATGGGVSVVMKLPKYQRGVKNIIKGGRNLPDISFDASPGSGRILLLRWRLQRPDRRNVARLADLRRRINESTR